MKAVFFVLLTVLVCSGAARSEPLVTTRTTPDEFKWVQTPSGSQRAILVGDEQKPGMYMYRCALPGGLQGSTPFSSG